MGAAGTAGTTACRQCQDCPHGDKGQLLCSSRSANTFIAGIYSTVLHGMCNIFV